ncbi:hypothetical protein CCHR01_19589 [Colletotrichum chrysophilum]|uniref:Uncharacterized protein n=1 Tax=Colletotrichum chrysophilum TaxID=1836956 RepID=A0AAD9A099_9PEZI|nr:hypothetical protein CCHR01_19589 [Colletotrichum chrysophilum]
MHTNNGVLTTTNADRDFGLYSMIGTKGGRALGLEAFSGTPWHSEGFFNFFSLFDCKYHGLQRGVFDTPFICVSKSIHGNPHHVGDVLLASPPLPHFLFVFLQSFG